MLPLMSYGVYADRTDRQTDGRRLLHCAFRYGRGQRNKRQMFRTGTYTGEHEQIYLLFAIAQGTWLW